MPYTCKHYYLYYYLRWKITVVYMVFLFTNKVIIRAEFYYFWPKARILGSFFFFREIKKDQNRMRIGSY